MHEVERRGAPAPLLELRGITKRFGDLVANDQIDLELLPGEVHALLGENGAGKTTLMNILYGLYHPDAGEIILRGKPIQIASPRQAIEQHIGMVHQHFMLVPNFTVVENVILGMPLAGEPYLDLRRAAQQVADLAARFKLQVDPYALVGDLPVGLQQRVEILKALYRGAELLILDEPTAVLTPLEVQEFFQILRQLVQQGLSVIFISHKLSEVLEVSDRISVLRRGRLVGTLPTSQATIGVLAEMMVGRTVDLQVNRAPAEAGAVVLRLEGISARNNQDRQALREVHLEIRAGEILGIAGVDGNGQQELAETVTGLRPPSGGRIWLDGQDVTGASPAELIRRGVAYIPADRQQMGLVLDFSVADNLVLKRVDTPDFCRRGVLSLPAIQSFARQAIREYDIRASSLQQTARQLSGGNQQKVILAREIEGKPRLLVAMHPTRGLDIGAMEYVQGKLLEQRQSGVAILLISTELEELLALSDRIAVLYRGEVMGIVPAVPEAVDAIAHMMLGERVEAAHDGR